MVALLFVPPRLFRVEPLYDDVFVSGRLGGGEECDTFRIPALCRTKRGTLLAFAEGRKSVADQAGNAIVLRRRPAKAKGWEPLRVVESDAPNALNNPCALATRGGRVWLMYQRYPAGFAEYSAKPGYDPARSCLSFVTYSDDDGRTWSAPRDLSRSIKPEAARSLASGPGIGIELRAKAHRGRLLFPFNRGLAGAWDVYGVWSDDRGRTWSAGPVAPKAEGTQPNETQVVELADGTVLMNARNQAAGRFRLQGRSHDGGASWERMIPVPELVDPVCQGSIVRRGGRPDLLAFSNANDAGARVHGTLRLSADGGRTWRVGSIIEPGSFGYSCLCPLPARKLGILYETVEDAGGREAYRIRYRELDAGSMLGEP